MTAFDHLPCTCRPDQDPRSYAVGCERHIAIELAKPPSARYEVETHTKTFYHASVTISTPVMQTDSEFGAGVASQQRNVECGHDHVSLEQARISAQELAGRHVGRANARARRF